VKENLLRMLVVTGQAVTRGALGLSAPPIKAETWQLLIKRQLKKQSIAPVLFDVHPPVNILVMALSYN